MFAVSNFWRHTNTGTNNEEEDEKLRRKETTESLNPQLRDVNVLLAYQDRGDSQEIKNLLQAFPTNTLKGSPRYRSMVLFSRGPREIPHAARPFWHRKRAREKKT